MPAALVIREVFAKCHFLPLFPEGWREGRRKIREHFILGDKNTHLSKREWWNRQTDGSWQGVERTMRISALLDPCGVSAMSKAQQYTLEGTQSHTPLFQKQVNGDRGRGALQFSAL